jgi:drug/metabolite transporter (DMT)-like permease
MTPLHENTYIAMSLMIISAALLALGAYFANFLLPIIGVALLIWARFIGCALVMWWTTLMIKPQQLLPNEWTPLLLRTVFALTAQYFFYLSLSAGSILLSILFFNTSPLFLPFIRKFVNHQKIHLRVWVCISISFIGVILVLSQGLAFASLMALFGLIAGFLNACSQVVLHQASQKEDPFTLNLWIYTLGAVVSSFSLIFIAHLGNKFEQIYQSGMLSWALILIIIIGVSVQVIRSKAYTCIKEPSVIAPGMYAAIIISALLDWYATGALPSITAWFGILLICGASIYLTIKSKNKNDHPIAIYKSHAKYNKEYTVFN